MPSDWIRRIDSGHTKESNLGGLVLLGVYRGSDEDQVSSDPNYLVLIGTGLLLWC